MDFDDKRQNHVNFLVKAASILPSDNHFHKLLRSYYLTKCRRLTESGDNTDKNLFGEEEMCKKCSTPWFDANFSLSIAPIKATKRKAHKIHKQIDKKSNRKSDLAKKLSKKVNNMVTITCRLCATKNMVPLWKKASNSKKSAGPNQETNVIATKESKIVVNKADKVLLEPIAKKALKKKRKKDKNAGLLYAIDKGDNSVKAVSNIKQKLQRLNIEKPSTSTSLIQNKKKHQNSGKNKPSLQIHSKINMKANSTKKVAKNIPQPAAKRNNLLQLANALKSKTNQSATNSHADKLKQLLS